MSAWRAPSVGAMLLVLAACHTVNPPPPEVRLVEVQRSEEQRLLLRNDQTEAFTLLPAAPSASERDLAPGEILSIPFRIASVAPLENEQTLPWYRISEVGIVNYLVPPPPAYLTQAGSDAEIHLRQPDGTFRAIQLTTLGCLPSWGEAPAPEVDHRLDIGEALQRPAGVPVTLCPKAR